MLMDFDFCRSEFEKYGIVISSEQYEKFDKYADFLVKYNENVNLTSITEPQQILTKHFIDSVLITKYIDFPLNSTIIDVGTGAGFPSIPVKIIRPDLKITLLDSLAKRIKFLNELCNLIDINAELIHGRAEDFGKMPEYREKFDFSCARAVANLSVLSEYCMPFVKKGGKFIAMKGPNENPEDSIKAILLLGGRIGNVFDYSLDGDKRKIVNIRKISQTPTNYPRNSSQIKKKTL
ncbi:MAG: 16S rRNA (guanine(527)-N(7))-methyltransferase RsmG [Ruminococcus sp.]|nr:16S rRNA (guanine(527)-N(7))-methyltransferase RsmG [Ruminococcus sp.]MDE6783790.1 16S rRNA (guanine(527)-N(7))-methyltransferase RsmG [Ruminococcus sp.]